MKFNLDIGLSKTHIYMHELYNYTMDVTPTAFSLSRFPLSYCPRRPVSSAKSVAPLREKKNLKY